MVEIFDRFLIDLNQQRAENESLTKDQVKVLEERALLEIYSVAGLVITIVESCPQRYS